MFPTLFPTLYLGILANCLPQRYVDPGLLKPVVQTLLKLLKSPRLVTVKHCLRIVSAISNSQRGSEILLEMSTALYLRHGSPDDRPGRSEVGLASRDP